MIEQDTIKLLRECDAGIKMGVTSIDDLGYTDDGKKIVGKDADGNPIVDDNYVAGEATAEDAAKKVAYEQFLAEIKG